MVRLFFSNYLTMKTIELLSVFLLLAGEAPVVLPQDAQTLQNLLVNLNAKYNCFCPNVVEKVCGSDGTTYNNICFLECFQQVKSNLAMVHEGACAPGEKKPKSDECLCPDEDDTICGSDGKDYRNECEFECMRKKDPKLQIASREECTKFKYVSIYDEDHENQEKTPSKEDDSSDGDTSTVVGASKMVDQSTSMDEEWEMENADQHLDCDCPKISQPVCASDGKFYTNMCFLRCYQKKSPKLKSVSKSYCSQTSEENDDMTRSRDCDCPDEVRPVCGSDGTIYTNLCLLSCQKSQNRGLIEVDFDFCRTKNNWNDKTELPDETNPCICSKVQEPVCGTDYRTYPNKCFLDCFRIYNTSLEVLAEMPCELVSHNYKPDAQWSDSDPTFLIKLFSPNCSCPEDHQPVCGSDGKTYGNECLLNCERDIGRKLTLVFHGACDDTNPEPSNLLSSLLRLPDLPIMQFLNKLLLKSNRCECPQNEKPVCGSNGRTYFNICFLKCSQEKNPGLLLVAEMACERLPTGLQQGLVPNAASTSSVPAAPQAVANVVPSTGSNNYCNCFDVLQPVCGSDGKTYMNLCYLYCNKVHNPNLYLLGYNVCQGIEEISTENILRHFNCYCRSNFEPVCASDGRVYPNMCILECITQYYPHITLYGCELDWNRLNMNPVNKL